MTSGSDECRAPRGDRDRELLRGRGRRIGRDHDESVSTSAAVLNTLLLLALMRFQSVQPELAYLGLLVVGALEFACALLPMTKKRRQAFVVLSVMGAALLLASVPFHYTGNNVAILWLVGTEVFLIAGLVGKEIVFRRIGLLTGLLVGGPGELRRRYEYYLWRWDGRHQCDFDRPAKLRVSEWSIRPCVCHDSLGPGTYQRYCRRQLRRLAGIGAAAQCPAEANRPVLRGIEYLLADGSGLERGPSRGRLSADPSAPCSQ